MEGIDCELEVDEKDAMGNLNIRDNEGNTRTLKKWVKQTNEFIKDHAAIEVDLSSKHKKILTL